MGKGEYGWVYPLITNRYGQAVKKPFFGQLIDAVDKGSKFSDIYYDVATSKSHGRFVWSPLMVRPEGRGTHVDSFSVGGIALVMELMIPQFEEILVNTSPTCTQPAHRIVMDLVVDFRNRYNVVWNRVCAYNKVVSPTALGGNRCLDRSRSINPSLRRRRSQRLVGLHDNERHPAPMFTGPRWS